MATEVNILFTGICLFLTDSDRVILGVAGQKRSCDNTADIPQHHAYLTYNQSQLRSGKSVWKSYGDDHAVLLSGMIDIRGDFLDRQLIYPGSKPKLPNVVVTRDIAPGYTPKPTVLANDPARIDPAVVAARIDLPPGRIEMPTPTNELWHFVPQKPLVGVHTHIAQAVVLVLQVSDDVVQVTERPFGGGGSSEVVTLEGRGVPIFFTVGNSSYPDITPPIVQTKPATGPDHDFELHWNLFDLNNDPDCPPISYNEGLPGHGPRTVGGGNCPPTQWP